MRQEERLSLVFDDFQGRTVSKAIEVWVPKEDGNNTEL
jgi:hypothetical protein